MGNPVTAVMDYLLFVSTLTFVFTQINGELCVFHSPCSCDTSTYKINLKPMMEANKNPLQVTYLGATYYLDPCGTALNLQVCKSLGPLTAGCQVEGKYPYGIAETTGYSATGDPDKGKVVFTYSYGVGSAKRTTKLKLQCSSEERRLVFESENPTRTYNLKLFTKYACKDIPSGDHGLSLGSILLIIFFVLLIVYICAGILFLKYYRKEEGVDIIPNRTFWVEIPVLVKDGFVFVVGKIKGTSTYSPI